MTTWTSKDGCIELRLGRWQDVCLDVRADVTITDPPYSARTHKGALSGSGVKHISGYVALTPEGARALMRHLDDVTEGWIVVHTDHLLATLFEQQARVRGRVAFAPVPVLQHMPRLSGDGPGSHGHYLSISRPCGKPWSTWGSLPGWYEAPRDKTGIVRGAKSLGLMRALVRDYSKPDDLVYDPHAGGATTLIAAWAEGRRAIGCEVDPETFANAVARLEQGVTRRMI